MYVYSLIHVVNYVHVFPSLVTNWGNILQSSSQKGWVNSS